VAEVEVRGVGAAAGDDQPVLVLQERHGQRRCVPIWIGTPETVALAAATADRAPSRPLTHRLLLDVLAAVGAQLTGVRITGIVADQFHAELDLTWTRPRTGSRIVVSARASDAVTLALHHHCPIHVSEAVLERAGLPAARVVGAPDHDPAAPMGPGPDTPAIEDQVEALRAALTEATPEDFRPDTPADDEHPAEDDPGDDTG
jgi:bifunctional DNase/RNase